MKTLLVLLLLLFATAAQAQTTVVVDLNRALLQWNWTKGTNPGVDDGDVAEFVIKCGNAPLVYNKETVLANPAARSIAVKDAIRGSGDWFCIVTARNQFGESGASNEVPFAAGVKPSSPSNLSVAAQ